MTNRPTNVVEAEALLATARRDLQIAERALTAAQQGFHALPTEPNRRAVLVAADARADGEAAVKAAEGELERCMREEDAEAREAASAAIWLAAERERIERIAGVEAQLAALHAESAAALARVQAAHDRAQQLGAQLGVREPLGVRPSENLAQGVRVLADHEAGRRRIPNKRELFLAISAAVRGGLPVFGADIIGSYDLCISAELDGTLNARIGAAAEAAQIRGEAQRAARELGEEAARVAQRAEMTRKGLRQARRYPENDDA